MLNDARRFPWEVEGETVAFETPELTRVEYRIAPFGTRIAAALIDRLLLAFILLVIVLAVLTGAFAAASERSLLGAGGYLIASLIIVWFLVSTFYFVWAEVRREGRTWGKRFLGIRTIMATGHGVTLGAAIVRNLARVIDDLPVLWVVPALNPARRRLGDYLAGTLVVQEAAKRAPADAGEALAGSYRELPDKKFYFSAEVAAKLYPDDLNLLEHLRARIAAALPGQRERVLAEVSSRYVARLGLEEEKGRVEEDPQRFLDELELFLKERFEDQSY